MWSRPRCEHKGVKTKTTCDSIEARPQFTAKILGQRGTPKQERQPHYYCPKHERFHPDLSPITGGRRERYGT